MPKPLKGWLLLAILVFGVGIANAVSIDVYKVTGKAENNILSVEYALLGTDYVVADFVTYVNSVSGVPDNNVK